MALSRLLSLGQLCPCPSQTGQHLVTLGLVYTEAALCFGLVSRTISASCLNCFSISGYGEASSSKSEDTTRCSLHLQKKYQNRSHQRSTRPVSSKETKRTYVFYTADPREGFVRFQFRRQGAKLHNDHIPRNEHPHTCQSLCSCCLLSFVCKPRVIKSSRSLGTEDSHEPGFTLALLLTQSHSLTASSKDGALDAPSNLCS